MMSVERAAREHEELLALAGELRAVVGGRFAPELAHSLLREFASRLEDHRRREEQSLYQPLLAFAEQKSAQFRSVLHGMLSNAGTDWSSYLTFWTQDRIDADWSTFGEETRRVLDRGRARLCLEDAVLYPLAMREGIVPLRA